VLERLPGSNPSHENMAQAKSGDSTSAQPQDSLYLPTDVTPEQLFRAIGRRRMEARREINRLIQFLDKTDDYVSRAE
jgi:hypothetical protein